MAKEAIFAVCAALTMILLLMLEDWVQRADGCVEVLGHVVELGSRNCDHN
jgi:hypothetical protein